MGSGGGASERRGAEERTLTCVVQGAAPAAACGAAMRAAEAEVAPRAAAIAAAVAERPMAHSCTARSCTARRAQRMALRGSRGRSFRLSPLSRHELSVALAPRCADTRRAMALLGGESAAHAAKATHAAWHAAISRAVAQGARGEQVDLGAFQEHVSPRVVFRPPTYWGEWYA